MVKVGQSTTLSTNVVPKAVKIFLPSSHNTPAASATTHDDIKLIWQCALIGGVLCTAWAISHLDISVQS